MRAALVASLLALAPLVAAASEYPLEQARQIIPRDAASKLRRAGLRSTLDLITRGATARGRTQIAQASGLELDQVAGFVALADLMRVRGIGPDVARLLTAAGVRTLSDLQQCDPNDVAAKIRELNKERKLSTNPPGVESISYWIGLARLLPVVLE
jgi:hypothetical protein